ncbi:MAG: hypothetical protein GWN93_05770 [Deltaproteobacteria bacterium]|nr:hypothetical protein [Deltaproteobacteria bacterium]
MPRIVLAEAIRLDKETGNYILAEEYGPKQIDDMLRQIAYGTLSGYDLKEAHELLAQNIVEPIRQSVPYFEMYNRFFQEATYAQLEDNSIPIEDIPTVVWETHRDGQVAFVRANYRWTRPEFTTFDAGIEVNWTDLKRAGWNYLARQMQYATENLARQRDTKAKAVLDAAIPAGHAHTVSGGSLTRAGVKAVQKAAMQIGFPMTQCLVNPGTLTDMSDWTFPAGSSLPEREQRELLTTLFMGEYGGANFYGNAHASTTVLYFGGPPTGIGWQQKRGSLENASDVDIRRKIDIHAIYDQDHAWYVGNGYNLRTLTITA